MHCKMETRGSDKKEDGGGVVGGTGGGAKGGIGSVEKGITVVRTGGESSSLIGKISGDLSMGHPAGSGLLLLLHRLS